MQVFDPRGTAYLPKRSCVYSVCENCNMFNICVITLLHQKYLQVICWQKAMFNSLQEKSSKSFNLCFAHYFDFLRILRGHPPRQTTIQVTEETSAFCTKWKGELHTQSTPRGSWWQNNHQSRGEEQNIGIERKTISGQVKRCYLEAGGVDIET